MTEDFMTVEEALTLVWDLANQNALTEEYTLDDTDLQPERIKQQTALSMTRDFMLGQKIEPIREAPEGSSFITLFVAYLFENKSQFRMFDEAEGEARHTVDCESHGVISLLAWNRRSGFPTPQDFDKFHREVSEELGDIPFIYPEDE